MKYQAALKVWNEHHKSVNPKHVWMMPRKGTPEHTQVKEIAAKHATPEDYLASKAKHSANFAEHNRKVLSAKAAKEYEAKEPEMAARRAKALEGLRAVEAATKARNISRLAPPKVAKSEAAARFMSPEDFEKAFLKLTGDETKAKKYAKVYRERYPGKRVKFWFTPDTKTVHSVPED